ncbi:calcium-binding mitochondrial carrier protein Aralar2 [Aulographum hederae CBS 113979]|uniref:Calcium-binding mitochondrial carrier protein Aralar2 n=1 Tax=Aulographum hederae CBS 113979 TaxID=1176131 RepID=A0A6G1H0R5_9PEZI|nr:calcium-binding mitochondrial carrier protein Aralar2 [Aulographum hederae CBS 113979]
MLPGEAPLARLATRMPDQAVSILSGAIAGMASGVVSCPFDVIKTRLQAQGAFNHGLKRSPRASVVYHGMSDTARAIWKEGGIRGMYRGLSPSLLGLTSTWAVYMMAYESTKEFWKPKFENKWIAHIMASVSAGACSTIITNPIWVIKTRLMTQASARSVHKGQTPWHYQGTVDAARKMFRNEGLRTFYSGLSPALLGLTHVAIQFPLYEYLRLRFTGLEMGESGVRDASGKVNSNWFGTCCASFISKTCATCATYPHEILRTRLQTQQRTPSYSQFESGLVRPAGSATSDGMINLPRYRGVVRTFKIILAEEGWRAFYNGMGTNLVRTVPAAMTTMITFEAMKSTITSLQEHGRLLEDVDSREGFS